MEVDKENAALVTPPRPVIDLTGVQPDSDGDVERFQVAFSNKDFSEAVEHGRPIDVEQTTRFMTIEAKNQEIVFFIVNWNVSTCERRKA